MYRGSGYQMRDFIHIDDCVNAVVKSMNKIHNADPLNLSTGKYTNFIKFAKIAANLIGASPKVIGTSKTPEKEFLQELVMQKKQKKIWNKNIQ